MAAMTAPPRGGLGEEALPVPRSLADKCLVFFAILYMVSLPLEMFVATAGRSWAFYLSTATMASWVIAISQRGRAKFDFASAKGFWIVLALLAFYTTASLMWTSASSERYLTYVGLLFMIPALARAFSLSGQKFVYYFIASCTGLAAFSLKEFSATSQRVLITSEGTEYSRVSIANLNDNDQAAFLTIACVWSVWLLFRVGRRARLALIACALANFAGVLATGSRTGAVALFLGLVAASLMSVWGRQKRGSNVIVLIAAGSAIAVVFWLVAPILPQRLWIIGQDLGTVATAADRLVIWQAALSHSEEWIWTGVGLGQSGPWNADYYGISQVLHNTLLTVFVELGFIGFLLTVALVVTAFFGARRGANLGLFSVALLASLPLHMALSLDYDKLAWALLSLAVGGFEMLPPSYDNNAYVSRDYIRGTSAAAGP